MRFLLADSNESILGRKDWGLYVFSHGKLNIFQNFLITEKTENFLSIFVLEIFNLNFEFPVKF